MLKDEHNVVHGELMAYLCMNFSTKIIYPIVDCAPMVFVVNSVCGDILKVAVYMFLPTHSEETTPAG